MQVSWHDLILLQHLRDEKRIITRSTKSLIICVLLADIKLAKIILIHNKVKLILNNMVAFALSRHLVFL